MSNHLRNIRALLENAKDFEVSRKVDTYEYESLEKMLMNIFTVIKLAKGKAVYTAWATQWSLVIFLLDMLRTIPIDFFWDQK
jgi:hypothetical protein